MKKCATCKETKHESEFYRTKEEKDHLKHSCKKCLKEYDKKRKKDRKDGSFPFPY